MNINQIDFESEIGTTFPIAIVVSRFNKPITEKLLNSSLKRLNDIGFSNDLINVVHVPGAVEIPLVCKKIAQQNKVKAIITLGAVIRGETTHYDYVCQQVSDGCLAISLEYQLPVIFGVLTTETCEQAFARAGGSHSDKGIDCADAAIEMVQVIEQLDNI